MIGLKKAGLRCTISKFTTEHNHEFFTPKSTNFLRGHRVVTPAQKNLIDTHNESGVLPRKIMLVLSKEFGVEYNVGFIAIDVQNYFGNRGRFIWRGRYTKKSTIIFLSANAKS
jgi:hypothetical protein